MTGLLLACLAGGAILAGWVLRPWFRLNVVETGRTPEYPDLLPRTFVVEPDVVLAAARRVVARLPRWSLAAEDRERGVLKAEARTRLFRFVDDVEVRVTPEGPGARVNVRSASRIGRGDLGQNARNVRRFVKELERELRDRERGGRRS